MEWLVNMHMFCKKVMEVPGIEPGAFRMQSERDTTTPHPQGYKYAIISSF